VVFRGTFLPPRSLMIGARDSLDAFQQARGLQPISVINASATLPKWEKPCSGWIKINWDASVDKAKQVMGVGFVAMDFMGRVRAFRCMTLSYIFLSHYGEGASSTNGVGVFKSHGFSEDLVGRRC
jgi:hypothetical protein